MNLKRRAFIKSGVAAGTGLALTPFNVSSMVSSSSNKPIRIGFAGVGSRGFGTIKRLLRFPDVEIPAICDINLENLKQAQQYIEDEGYKRPDGYSRDETDFKRMCKRDDLDLVITATSWEWHTPICVAAMEAGKHAASEVPIAVTEEECWQ